MAESGVICQESRGPEPPHVIRIRLSLTVDDFLPSMLFGSDWHLMDGNDLVCVGERNTHGSCANKSVRVTRESPS
jgi:hypothetical protein